MKHELEPVLVFQCEEGAEIMVVQVRLGHRNIRIFNAYGPQEQDVSAQTKFNFWQNLEKEIISAYESNCEIIIELDANAKVGPNVIPNDPHCQSENGRLMMEMLARQNLHLVNASRLCKGLITRQRAAAGRVEKSILDYVIVSEELYNQLEEMIIDDERIHVLTKYATTMGVQKLSESDHNILFAKFKVEVQRKQKTERVEVFDFKNNDSQKLFFEETNCVQKFREIISAEDNIEMYSQNMMKKLNSIFHKCFKRIQITG